MTKHPRPNWKRLATLVESLNSHDQVKFMYKFPNSKFSIRAISVSDVQKKVWDLFEKGVESIIVANKRNRVLFEYRREFVTSNRISEALNHNPTVSEQAILEWKDMSEKTRESWLDAVLLESIYQYEETEE